jgi:hypothetical protein
MNVHTEHMEHVIVYEVVRITLSTSPLSNHDLPFLCKYKQ